MIRPEIDPEDTRTMLLERRPDLIDLAQVGVVLNVGMRSA